MLRQVAVLCSILLIWASCVCSAKTVKQNSSIMKPSLKETLATLPSGSAVVVETRDKRTLKGRLGKVTDDDLELQQSKSGSVVIKKLAFADLMSIKEDSHHIRNRAVMAGFTVVVVFGILVIFRYAL